METDKTNLKELKKQVEELREKANLEGELHKVKWDLWKVRHNGLVKSWDDAKRDSKELGTMFKNFIVKINQQEDNQMETDTAQDFIDLTDQPEEYEEACGFALDMQHAPTDLTI